MKAKPVFTNRTKKLSIVNCSVTRDIDLMQIIQYCLESAGTPHNTNQLFAVLNLLLIARNVYLLRKFITSKETEDKVHL